MRKIFILIMLVIFTSANTAFAEDMTELKEQIKELTQTVKNLNNTVEELKSKDEARQKEMNTLRDLFKASASNASVSQTAVSTQEQLQEVNEKVDSVVEAQKKSLPGEFNPAIGLVGETVFSHRSGGSDVNGSERPGGFDVFQRSTELNISASVDPFTTAYAVINATADASTSDATLGVEEAAIQTTSLPWNLTAKAGRFFGEFGRLSYIHDHELPFVNRPLVLDRYIGGESQTDGVQASWLVPVEHYINLTVGAGDKFGDPQNNPGVFRSNNELNIFGRLSTYFDLTPDWQVETGISGLINPSTVDRGGVVAMADGSTVTEKERRLAGMDFSLRYVPLRNNQFQSFTWGTEVLYSDNRYSFDPDATPDTGDEFTRSVGAAGLYSYVAYKMDRQWTAGGTFDYVENAQNQKDQTSAYSVFLTYGFSHWNELRLEYTHTDNDPLSGLQDDDAVYLQWSWIIGAHSHGWQQR